MQNPTTRATRHRKTATAALAALTTLAAAGGTAHAAPPPTDTPPSVSIAIGTAIAVTATCPGVNQYLNNTNPTPTCPVMSPPLTVENQVPYIVEHHPAYGWYPATCILAGHRWDGFYDPYTTQQAGGINAAARVVRDDSGTCSGPTVPMHIAIGTQPWFGNIYGIGGPYPACSPGGSNETGALVVTTVISTCAPHTYAGIFGDWERGHYRLDITITTSNGRWVVSGTHQIM